MIVSSFFTFSPFLTGLGPVDDVAYPPVVRAQLADFLALALALAFDQLLRPGRLYLVYGSQRSARR